MARVVAGTSTGGAMGAVSAAGGAGTPGDGTAMMVAGEVVDDVADEGPGARAAGRPLAQEPIVNANATTALA